MPYFTRKKLVLLPEHSLTLAVDLNDEKTWSLSGHYPLYRGNTHIIKGIAVRVMDENGRVRQEINKPYDFFIKQLLASYTVNNKVAEARVLILPQELVNGYALSENEVIELILTKVIRGFKPEDEYFEDIYPEIQPYFIGPVDIELPKEIHEKKDKNMTDFTYEIPNEDNFLSAVLILIRRKGYEKLASLLCDSKCSIITSSSYSKKRWNAYYTTVDFSVPQNKYDEVSTEIDMVTKKLIIDICDEVMPPKAGLDIMDVTVSISLEDALQKVDTIEDLKKMTDEIPEKVRSVIMPDDIKAKAKVMSEVYLYTYCAENALRAFIEGVAIKNFGPNYFSKLKLNTEMQGKIKERKRLQAKKKWLSARGTSDIFYLDIEDLGWIIANNWDIFKNYFPRLDWITVNISELADCRNQVAHHSYLQEHERDVIRTNFYKIIKQIGDTFEKTIPK